MSDELWDLAIVGAGAAGLMAAIQAGRARPGARIVVLDGARTLGAKILVAGGGRCNVTHRAVEPADFAGSTQPAVRKVLARFGVAETTAFFAALGVFLKEEDTGKLFPTTDRARTVLDALLTAARDAGAVLRFPARVESIGRSEDGTWRAAGPWGRLAGRRLLVATGGQSLPKSGSDGWGYQLMRSVGHGLNEPLVPALSPLLLPTGHPAMTISGVAAPARATVRTASGKRLATAEGAILHTHFGLSGPAILDISRHLLLARHTLPDAILEVNWLPQQSSAEVEALLLAGGKQHVLRTIGALLPARLAERLLAMADIERETCMHELARERRKTLVRLLTAEVLPVVGARSWTHAEATAGGVPLAEFDLATLASRIAPGLHAAGEILDVDGRLGGFNFQWAWASGAVAGWGVARLLEEQGARVGP